MLARYYADALFRCKNENSVENLFGVLKEKGHVKLLTSILSEYEKLVAKCAVEGVATLRVSRIEDADRALKVVESFMKEMSINKESLAVEEDPFITGGFVLRNSGREVDGSYRRRLVELYNQLISVRSA